MTRPEHFLLLSIHEKGSGWVIPGDIDEGSHLGRQGSYLTGFAWDFLRRNQDYRAGYARIIGAENDSEPELANAAVNFAWHWELIG